MSDYIPTGYIDPDFPNPGGPHDANIIIYGYTPSTIVAVLGIVLFSATAVLHAVRLYQRRTYYFSVPLLVAAVMEIVGYIARLLSSKRDPYSIIYFVLQYFFIVVAPVLISASIYTLVSLLIGRAHDTGHTTPDKTERIPRHLPQPRLVLVVFIGCDIGATILQIAGAALVGVSYSKHKDPTTFNNILLAGLAFQTLSFTIFIILFSWVLWRLRHRENLIPPRAFVVAVLVTTLAVYLRTIFRLAETAQGLMASLSSHEVFFGCLEFAPVVLAMVLLGIWHPGVYFADVRSPFRKQEFEGNTEDIALK